MNRLCLATNGLLAMNAQRALNCHREPDGMQFLKTLFWILVAVLVALFVSRNWTEVTLNLWGDIEIDIKIPLLLVFFFLLGFLPTWLLMRTRIWSHRRPRIPMRSNEPLLRRQKRPRVVEDHEEPAE